MYRLRQLAILRGVANESVWFYREFVDNLLKRGTVYGPELMLAFARRVGLGPLMEHFRMGMEMALQGRLLFKPRSVVGGEALRQIAGKALKDGERGQ